MSIFPRYEVNTCGNKKSEAILFQLRLFIISLYFVKDAKKIASDEVQVTASSHAPPLQNKKENQVEKLIALTGVIPGAKTQAVEQLLFRYNKVFCCCWPCTEPTMPHTTHNAR